jgi:hypothetical protein
LQIVERTYDVGGLELDVASQPIRNFNAKVTATWQRIRIVINPKGITSYNS